ncbi:MAG: L,D-transpeptidase family protein [Burkholderiaceae bacterium]|nr:L,D-transpeptidase family protein [Burkholderiaceae bacterium]
MSFLVFCIALTKKTVRFPVLSSCLFALAALCCVSGFDAHAKKHGKRESATPTEVSEASNAPNPDFLLIEIFKNLRNNDLRQAQKLADSLVEWYPQFQLGHLIRGDLLLMHTSSVQKFGAAPNISAERLKDFREEAMVRIKAIRDKPDPDLVPRNLIQLRRDQKQVLVVDAKRARLFLYEHNNGELKFITDYYVSQGKFGINKYKEGDQKTPLGVYYVTSHLTGAKLPDFYGPGALPINYPNEWDKLNGRSGSGIWLHGVPSDNFSRPPLASDGCIVLTNDDFLRVAASVEIGRTPVVISEEIEFISKSKSMIERAFANKMIDDWRNDLESLNSNRILANYSPKFKTLQGETLNTWLQKQKQVWDGTQTLTIKLKDITHFRYPGKEELIVSTFTQEAQYGKTKSSVRKRQYWIKEATKWRIIYESQV